MKPLTTFQIVAIVILTALFAFFLYKAFENFGEKDFKKENIKIEETKNPNKIEIETENEADTKTNPSIETETETEKNSNKDTKAEMYCNDLQNNKSNFYGKNDSVALMYIKKEFNDGLVLIKTTNLTNGESTAEKEKEIEIKSFKCNDGSILKILLVDGLVLDFEVERF